MTSGHKPPRLELERFFDGEIRGWGVTQSRFGTLQNQFRIEATGRWDEASRTLSLVETYHFDDGHTDRLEWSIEKLSPNRFVGREPRMIGDANGEQDANHFRWRYTRRVPAADGSESKLYFDDCMWLQAPEILVARGSIRKFGVEIATLSGFYVKS